MGIVRGMRIGSGHGWANLLRTANASTRYSEGFVCSFGLGSGWDLRWSGEGTSGFLLSECPELVAASGERLWLVLKGVAGSLRLGVNWLES